VNPAIPVVVDDLLHEREVDDEPTIADGVASDVVAASSDGYGHVTGPRELHAGDDVGHSCAPGDCGGMPIDHPVPHPARLVVPRITRLDEMTGEHSSQFRKVAHFSHALLPGPGRTC
jgi:hypothetical protein